MNSRGLADRLDELETIMLANRLMFDYWKPAEIKESEPVTADEAEDRFYKNYITPQYEHKLIKQLSLPDWDENLKTVLIKDWPSWKEEQKNENLNKEPYIETRDFLSKIQILISNLILSIKYKIEDIKRNRDFKSDIGIIDLCNEAKLVIDHLNLFLKYLDSIKITEEDNVPELIQKQYLDFKARTKELSNEALNQLKEFDGLAKDNILIDKNKFKEVFVRLNQLKIPPSNNATTGSEKSNSPRK